VNESYGLQKKLWDSVKEIADKDIQQVNLELFTTLKESIREITKLGDYLKGINQYQANTTEAIDKMQKFFSLGIEQIDSININLKNALERFAGSSTIYLNNLQENLDGQILNLNEVFERQQKALQKYTDDLFKVMEIALMTQQNTLQNHFTTVSKQMEVASNEQQEIFKKKLSETTILIDELKKLSDVKSIMLDLVKATKEQKSELFTLNKRIEELAQIKTMGGELKVVQQIPRAMKVAAIVFSSIVTLAGLSYLVPQIVKWISELIK
jgi:hypothetical protein